MDGAVTDWMDRHDLGTATAFRDPMMPFYLSAKASLAKPAPLGFMDGDRPSLGLDQPCHPLHTSTHRPNMVYLERKNSGFSVLSDAPSTWNGAPAIRLDDRAPPDANLPQANQQMGRCERPHGRPLTGDHVPLHVGKLGEEGILGWEGHPLATHGGLEVFDQRVHVLRLDA